MIYIKDVPGVFSVGINGNLICFDKDFRLFYTFMNGKGYRRSLDNRILEKSRSSTGRRVYRFLKEEEKILLYKNLEKVIKKKILPIVQKEAKKFLENFLELGYDSWLKDREAFERIYGKVGILPPDQYLSVVVQVTRGCHWNRCLFCGFYRDVSFQILKDDEFFDHVEKVINFFKNSLPVRRRVFLGDANSLLLPTVDLIKRLEFLRSHFKKVNPYFDGFYSFLDVFTGFKKPVSFYRKLKTLGLKRVYIGLESGCEELLESLVKPIEIEKFVKLVEDLKKAELSLGIIVLIGVGDKKLRHKHLNDTLKLIKNLKLRANDIVYVSEFVAEDASEDYLNLIKSGKIEPYEDFEVEEDMNILRNELKKLNIKVSLYNVREFIY